MIETNLSGIETYAESVFALQKRVIEDQKTTLNAIAQQMAKTIANDGRIFLFGTGHSHMMMEEGFYRAGGLAAVVPIFYSALMLHEHSGLSSYLERTQGIAQRLLEAYHPVAGEMIIIYSNSGVNAMPVEMALFAKEKELKVVAVCSLEYAKVAPLSPIGKRLSEVADYVIDNGGVPGDALVPVPDTAWRVSPSSTLTNALIWNCLLTETVFAMHRMGVEAPLFASLNMAGAAAHNQKILAKWSLLNPHLK